MIGDCRESMRLLEAGSVQTCVTSPPYFGLRDYGQDRQIGLEPTPDEFVAAMVEVFREVHRVLADDGTLWLNLGDTYASAWVCNRRNVVGSGSMENGKRENLPNRLVNGLKEKDLIGIPWRVAFALQADGWYLRQDIIWHKPNPMPEPVKDRCTKAHEYIFLFSKKPKYYFDNEAIKEPAVKGPQRMQADPETARLRSVGPMSRGEEGFNHQYADPERVWAADGKRNRRSVWTVTTKPYKGAHFATFPPELIDPCVLAGSRPGDTVLDPFGGSGTTAGVALKHGRKAVLCELNPEYAALVPDRIASIAGEGWDLI
jgi:site-specific DNA-methyltransferase (adenine-specific)